jgi:hypothetical protein
MSVLCLTIDVGPECPLATTITTATTRGTSLASGSVESALF